MEEGRTELYCGFSIQNWQQFMDRNYHLLCLNLNPLDFLSWLRSKHVLSHPDQELVMNSQYTTVARMGTLVDLVKKKGENGFRAFMEVIEFSYPEIFCSITGQYPRTNPPAGYLPDNRISVNAIKSSRQQRPQSSEILSVMGDLVQTLFSGLTCKKEELSKLKDYCTEMQDNICREKADLYLQMKCSNEIIQILQKEKEELNSKLESQTRERQEMSAELENLRSIKDKYMEESSKLGKIRDELTLKVQQLEDELSRRHSPFSMGSCHSDEEKCMSLPDASSTQEINELSIKLNSANKKILVVSFENSQMGSQIKDMQRNYDMLKQDSDAQAERIKEIMTERDKIIAQKKTLEAELDNERLLNKKISKEFHTYCDKNRYMESELKKLQDELEHLKNEGRMVTSPPEFEGKQQTQVHSPTINISLVPSPTPNTDSTSESMEEKPNTNSTSQVTFRKSPVASRKSQLRLDLREWEEKVGINDPEEDSPETPVASLRRNRSPVTPRGARNWLEPVDNFSKGKTLPSSSSYLLQPPSSPTQMPTTKEKSNTLPDTISRQRNAALKKKDPPFKTAAIPTT